MKKNLFYLACIVMLLFPYCSKKSNESIKSEELFPVTFNVSNFAQEIVTMNKAQLNLKSNKSSSNTNSNNLNSGNSTLANTIKGNIQYLSWLIYNEAGVLIKSSKQTSSSNDFGAIKDMLPKGTYKIVIFGSVDEMEMVSTLGLQGDYLFGPIDDTLGKKFDFSVGYGSSTTQSITLERLVGKVEVVVTDLPATISGMVLTVNNVAKEFYFSGFNAKDNTKASFKNFSSNLNKIGRYIFFANNGNPYFTSVKIEAFDATGIVVTKVIENVEIGVNKKTVLTGKLFDANQSFNISVNSEWGAEINGSF